MLDGLREEGIGGKKQASILGRPGEEMTLRSVLSSHHLVDCQPERRNGAAPGAAGVSARLGVASLRRPLPSCTVGLSPWRRSSPVGAVAPRQGVAQGGHSVNVAYLNEGVNWE